MRMAFAVAMTVLALGGCKRTEPGLLLGTVEWDRVELIAEAAEPVIEIAVHEGQAVRGGQVLLRLDDRRAMADVTAAEAELARISALLAEQRNGARPEQIDEARERQRRAQTMELDAHQQLERTRSMQARKLMSPSDLERAQNAYQAAVAERRAAAAGLNLLLRGTRAETLEQTEAAARVAQARRDQAVVNLLRLTVTAPRDGKVDAIPVRVGDQPMRGSTVLSMLVGDAPYARVFVPASVRAQVQPGARYRVTVEGVSETFDATVRWVRSDPTFTPYYALTGDDASRLTYLTELTLAGAHAAQLPAGLPARALPVATAP
jgi:HlyD family secretion protein